MCAPNSAALSSSLGFEQKGEGSRISDCNCRCGLRLQRAKWQGGQEGRRNCGLRIARIANRRQRAELGRRQEAVGGGQ